MKLIFRLGFLCAVFSGLQVGQGSSVLPVSADQKIANAGAIFRGTVLESAAFVDPKDGLIYTRTVFQVNEVFKGKLGATVVLTHRGGSVGNYGEIDGGTPIFKPGEERLMFVSRRPDGRIEAHAGTSSALLLPSKSVSAPNASVGIDLLEKLRAETLSGPISGSDLLDSATSGSRATSPPPQAPSSLLGSSATNLLVGVDNLPARFLLPDRGEPIVYYVDADYLPAGMTLTQALGAVGNALGAWTNVSSVRYQFGGLQSFGQGADKVLASDGLLRIQLHDHYGSIGGSGEVLGYGGHGWTSNNTSSGWTTGGNALGNDFHKTVKGYVVLQHTDVFMQNITNFGEVLCHEIGHTLGLAHSSESPSESNPILSQAVMYYLAHGNGRGATLNSFDTNVIRQVHSPTNTPPYCYDRVMDTISASSLLSIPGVNTVQLRGYDLQGNSLSLSTDGATANNGSFVMANSNLTFNPHNFVDAPRLDPASGFYYDKVYARYSDGVNASPFIQVRVVSIGFDSYSEGISDTWRQTYFGNPNPSIGSNHHAGNDADADGFSNLQEFWLGSSPTNKLSSLATTLLSATNLQFEAKPYELYELYSSTNLTTWTRQLNPILATNNPCRVTGFTNGGPRQFFRVDKIP
jgi:hypothetical protein